MRLNTLWIGSSLGALERACLRSVVHHGHALVLWCYRTPAGVPEGVVVRDAAEILPESTVIRHRSGSVSLFSNRFRYELQRRDLGAWIDADVYLLAPLALTGEYVMGLEASGALSTAILRMPPDSPLLAPLLAPFEEREVPPWLGWSDRRAAKRRLRRTGRVGLSEMPWGSVGPRAVTAVVREHGLMHLALEPEILSPVHWRMAEWIRVPGLTLEEMVGPRSLALHLWNERIKGFKDEPAARGSFLARLQAEGAERPGA